MCPMAPYSYTYFYISVKTFGYLDIIYISTQTPDSDLMWIMTPPAQLDTSGTPDGKTSVNKYHHFSTSVLMR